MELIDTTDEELLKSAELTGIWENKLRKIEKGEYKASDFITELKSMLIGIVNNVKNDNSNKQISAQQEDIKSVLKKKSKENKSKKEVTSARKSASKESSVRTPSIKEELEKKASEKKGVTEAGIKCPQCGIGTVIKGKAAFGCSRWKEGCGFREPFKS